MNDRSGLLAVAMLAFAWPAVAADLPAPADMPARVIVSGRTSTLQEVAVAEAGQQIPKTYAGDQVKNTPGFAWWISRHYALKTDFPEPMARHYLTLLEMAYPHYVELFGGEPPGIAEKRMAVVYASTADQLRKALASDDLTWDFNGGGITYEDRYCAYAFPSGTLEYHKRYILLHECTHLFQMCLVGATFTSPRWYREGIADSLAHHVYDEQKKQLTVHVLDKATTHNYLDEGLRLLKAHPELTFQTVYEHGEPDRGVSFLMASYMLTDPDRTERLRLWRDEVFRLNAKDYQKPSAEWTQKLFGPWEKLNADFAGWAAARRSTFHYVDWGWEQEGDTLWSYGWPQRTPYSETDINLPPGEKPRYDPLRMDYPAEPPQPLVGPVARGVAEPAVGILLTFRRSVDRGVAGMGLGVIGEPRDGKPVQPSMLRLLVSREKTLVLDGGDLGMQYRSVALPDAFRAALAAGGHDLGMTVTIAVGELRVVLRAQDPKAAKPVEFTAAAPIDARQRKRLLERPLAVLSHNGWHGITPCCDDARRMEPDLSVPAPANRWRNPGDKRLYGLYKAAWLLGDKAPASLVALRQMMVTAADKDAAAQRKAMAAFDERIEQVVKEVRSCGATEHTLTAALSELTGKGVKQSLR